MKLKTHEILVLRTCQQDMSSYHGFQWKKKGVVTAPDWEPTYQCGHGLHGLPWGQGGNYLDLSGIWLVLKVDTSIDYMTGEDELTDKCKFRTCTVVYAGTREKATQLIFDNAPAGTIVLGLSLTGGNGSTLTGGDGSTLTGGNWSTLTGGYRSTLTGGDWSTLTGGYKSTLTGGNKSTLTWRIWDYYNYYRLITVYVGENGIKPNTAYKLVDNRAIEAG